MGREQTVNFLNNMRELCTFDLIQNLVKIGGPGMVVEIYETVYARKSTTEAGNFPNNVFLEEFAVRRRNASCMQYLCGLQYQSCITANIIPGTTIISNCWKAYNGTEELQVYQFHHFKVNHSENFVVPVSGAHTQGVKLMWYQAKRRNRRQFGTHHQMIDGYICELMWRQHHRNEHLFDAMLTTMEKN